MKKLLAILLVMTLAVGSFAGCAAPAEEAATTEAPTEAATTEEAPAEEAAAGYTAEDPLVLKLSHVFSVDTPMDNSAKLAATNIEERTGGAIIIEVSGNGTLPYGTDAIEQCARGADFISLYDPAVMADWVPDYLALMGPFLVSTRDEFVELCNSDVVAEMNAAAEEQGLKVLSLPFNFGFRNIASGKIEVSTVADLEGAKFRVPGSQIFIETFNALGANSITTPSSEVYNAIQTGLADAHETSLSDMAQMQMQEVISSVTMTNHFIGTSSAVMSNDVFMTMSEEQQTIVLEEFANAAEVCSAEYEVRDVEARAQFEELGIKFIEPTEEALAEFREKTAVVYSPDIFPGMTADIYDQLRAVIAE